MFMIPALLLADFVFTLVTLSRGLVCGMRVPNFYCKRCLRTLFRAADCIIQPLVTVAIPESLLEPQFAQATCLALLFAAARLWPGTPVRPVLLIEYGVLETLRSSQKKCVATRGMLSLMWSACTARKAAIGRSSRTSTTRPCGTAFLERSTTAPTSPLSVSGLPRSS